MITIRNLVDLSRKAYSETEVRYSHPVLYVVVMSDNFHRIEEQARVQIFCEETKISADDLSECLISASVTLLLVTRDEFQNRFQFLKQAESGLHWIALFDDRTRRAWAENLRSDRGDRIRAIHFYGFKGGQARTTVLASLAMSLAGNGFRVLMVDSDIEAPSISKLFNLKSSNLGSTLAGVCRTLPVPIAPIAVYQEANGRVDAVICVPDVEAFEMDVASFALRSSIEGSQLQQGVGRIRRFCEGDSAEVEAPYDFVLFDHRTGISGTVIPILEAWPGSVVVCARSEVSSDLAKAIVRTLLSASPEVPGAFVSFSLDPEFAAHGRTRDQEEAREALLEILADAVLDLSGGQGEADPQLFERSFIDWFHDRAFLRPEFPSITQMSDSNRQALKNLREALELPNVRNVKTGTSNQRNYERSPSGAVDNGWFIETAKISPLLQQNSQRTYVLGRKGTGKSRLFRELADRRLGIPLLSAAEYRQEDCRFRVSRRKACFVNSPKTSIRFGGPCFQSRLRPETPKKISWSQ